MVAKRRTTTVGEWPDRQTVPIDEWVGDWLSEEPFDMTGRPLEPGQWVVKATTSGRAANLEVRRVDRVENGRVYLGKDNKRRVDYPGRLLILDSWPLAEQE